MAAYWLTFKLKDGPKSRGWPIEELRSLVSRFDSKISETNEWWRISSYRAARPNDRVFVFKQGLGRRGIFGFGTIVGDPEKRDSINGTDGIKWRAPIQFEQLVDPTKEFLISYDDLKNFVPQELIDAQASGNSVPEQTSEELERIIVSLRPASKFIGEEDGDDGSFDPDFATQPERAVRAILVRRGQTVFRNALLDAYERRCAITNCRITDILEAAHISPYMDASTNHITNGLLLRSDIHTLFDCGLISIDPKTFTVIIADALIGSSYEALFGRKIRFPRKLTDSPSKKALEKHCLNFMGNKSFRRK